MSLCIADGKQCCCQPSDAEQPDKTRFCRDKLVARTQKEYEAQLAKAKDTIESLRGIISGDSKQLRSVCDQRDVLKREIASMRDEIAGFPNLTAMREAMIASADESKDLQAQLAQAREQSDYHRNLIELQGDEIKRQAAELQQAREQVAASMRWVPIAEAGLQAGEVVDIRNRRGTRFVNCTYRPDMEAFVNDVTGPSIVMAEFVTHILRITPPPSNPAERDV